MKTLFALLVLAPILMPFAVSAKETLASHRVKATIEDNGNWQLTDNEAGVTWHGEWQHGRMMKVVGSDNSCFIIGENRDGVVQLDCKDLKQISILLSYSQ